jgi:hypothetical protein
MEGTPPPAGQADDRSPARTVEQLRAAAELYLIERQQLPLHLLPSGLSGPCQWIALELRSMVVRRLRLVDRLRVAAANVTAQSIELIQRAPAADTHGEGPLNRRDVAAVENLTARILELDHQIPQWRTVLVNAADELGVAPAPAPGQEENSPPGR